MMRDLLLGSLYRSPAPARLHRHIRGYRKSAPENVSKQINHLSPKDQGVVIPLLALMQEWHTFLEGHIDPDALAEDEDLNADGRPTPRRLRACWPVGALIQWAGEGPVPQRKICNRPWACPWCYVRHVLKVYHRLSQGPLRHTPRGRFLVQVTMSLRPEMIAVDQEWVEFATRRQLINAHSALRPDVMEQQRLRLQGDFRRILTDIGIKDGLLTHRVIPALTREAQYSFTNEFSALGTIDLRSPKEIAEFRIKSGIDGDWLEYAPQNANPQRILARVLVAALPANHPNALRYLLCGTSAGYPLDKLPLLVRQEALTSPECRWRLHGFFQAGPWLHNGLPGAFGVIPLFLFDPMQWSTYLQETARLPLYRMYGDWRPREQDRLARQPVRLNSHVASVLRPAQMLWPSIRSEARTGSRGRPAYGSFLKAALKARGWSVSRRDVSRLIKLLQSQDRSPA
jgi:hypothetical protein